MSLGILKTSVQILDLDLKAVYFLQLLRASLLALLVEPVQFLILGCHFLNSLSLIFALLNCLFQSQNLVLALLGVLLALIQLLFNSSELSHLLVELLNLIGQVLSILSALLQLSLYLLGLA